MKKRIVYPQPLKKGGRIAVTAPSSGVEEPLHHLLKASKEALEHSGYRVLEGQTIRTNDKCVSTGKEERAHELQSFLLDDTVAAVIPPWGGEFLMDILPLLDWNLLKANRKPKWVLGYSDISTFMFAYTLLTGHATAHGTNYIDMSSGQLDGTSARWEAVLSTAEGETVEQASSEKFQSAWDFSKPGFQLDTPTSWKILGSEDDPAYEISLEGRLLGGCMDTLSILAGTPYAPVRPFVRSYCREEGVLWYLESCEMNAADIYRHLWQMKQCGWFEHAKGILIGRPAGYGPVKNFALKDALHHVFDGLGIPVLYDLDIGHVPPQLTLVNGAFTKVKASGGAGNVTMSFV
ncbi:S66 family peptidase [Paenibacillus chitinolyticus]|uniref:S66 family peptidase n=1 Tax=Paenibacillus chitinolyticus TaxID=79263 RepID=UPI001C44DA65|nr:S66 peptidase family protein [Paenibacillus chitinolyticus]MBV6714091.1 LD-carboxypeptidase [Paenibacillus chitinolyticus]